MGASFLTFGVYLLLRLGVRNSYVRRLVILNLRVNNSYVCG